MSKTTRIRQSAQSGTPLDDLGAWIARRSRLIRFVLAGLVALSLTGATVIALYGFLFSLTPDSSLYQAIDRPDILTILFVILAVVGFFFYWIGWRLMIGFDFAETPLVPGRGAAIWLMTGIVIGVVTACLSLVTLSTALQ
jgi:hypothetical protein